MNRMRSHARLPIQLAGSILLAVIGLISGGALQTSSPEFELTGGIRSALNRISADSLRGHLSFIASDLLQGRDTPSGGLDIAAEYIAAQFRRAGLEPAGDDGYFQTANWKLAEPDATGFELIVREGERTINLDRDHLSLSRARGFDIPLTPIVKVSYQDQEALAALKPEQVEGKIVLTEIPDIRRQDRSRWRELFRALNRFWVKMRNLKAAMVISVDRISATGSGLGAGRLIDPENPAAREARRRPSVLTIHDPRIVRMYDRMKPGETEATLSLHISAPVERPVRLRNVIGVLRGSDPVLRDTCVLITAHYDHVGVRGVGQGDHIYNGANDDGSGTVSVIELASALAALQPRPRRSLVFMTFFGEEKGLLGSRYYGRHPVFPVEKTIADVNLEQVGRTDSTEGPQLSNATLTGFDYSDLSAILKTAGRLTGIDVYKHRINSDAYFSRSDNRALADLGVPAHTLTVAFNYPDYHGAGDHWQKIDYDNMAKINRMVAVALVMMANNSVEPKWNESNPKTAPYLKAWRERHGH